ncbi:class I SAM-dependent methyltransferase [Micromonospora mirobrigensis]|uniref:Methyltransferase domain-containing protein n=1 Tax=Micromonospora mirobrigensis TaxID=262898 RepID=A0A1C4WPW4_9ACTN|nr:methyltransferase [Micromonospora mirobrigensis]SCE98285.1 Methyltransferase domain-containing protein [Micromonospora mirobrigensis]
MGNSWMANSAALLEAYARHNDDLPGVVRQRLLDRAITAHLPPGPARVVDVGGGAGFQAVGLARAGHEVVLLDPDPAMLADAARRLADEPGQVRDRVRLVQGYGEQAPELVGGGFDLVCCHGILMYVDDPALLLRSVTALARPGGLLSVLAKNAESVAMRPALEGRWSDAVATLRTGVDAGGRTVDTRADTVEGVSGLLAAAGARPRAWYGLRIFTDHLRDVPGEAELDQLCELEWEAGRRDPYRRVARLFHVVAERDPA